MNEHRSGVGTYEGFPNRISRIILRAMRRVMNEPAMQAVLTTARLSHLIDTLPPSDFEPGLSFEEVSRLFEAVESIHGIQGGRQMLRRAGSGSFQYWVEGFEGGIGFADFALRLLPMRFRLWLGLEIVSEIFTRYTGQDVTLRSSSEGYAFVLDRCGFCWRRRSEAPVCAFVEGLLEAVLLWVSRGERFQVEETTCIACGDPVCTFSVDREPLI